MQDKKRRQAKLRELLRKEAYANQEELLERLVMSGIETTQASVSRDLDELGIVKVNGAYAQQPRRSDGLGIALLSVETAGPNMIVVKTAPGLASATTVRIDAAKLPGIVGTIAGDDTIFIAVSGENEQRGVIKGLWELFEG